MFHHTTVLLEEAVDGLHIQPEGIYVDCTLGGAGHSERIASRLVGRGRLIALDQDETAIQHAHRKLQSFENQVTLVKSNFRHLKQVLMGLDIPVHEGIPQVDGILFDLGVSSPQLDEAERGFSYNQEAALDMRMDTSSDLTAYDVVNTWDEEELARILFEYGEEKFSRRIAARLKQEREKEPIRTTLRLAEIIKEAIPAAARRTGPHPAKRSFQAIRIAVNDELGALHTALEQAIECLAPGGRLSVITFHSLEDRICKQTFTKQINRCTCPPDLPVCVCGLEPRLKLVNRKPLLPSERELKDNPRARSAKLRVAEKL